MDKITFLDVMQIDGSTKTFAIIYHGNDEFTSMPKSVWDEQQAQQAQQTGGVE